MSYFITYKNAKIHFTDEGTGEIILLLHGFLENATMWDDLSYQLIKTHRVVCVDLLGHGKSESLGYIHTMETMADALFSVLQHLKIERVTIIGHSMGGYVALALSEIFHGTILGLVLFHSTSFADSVERKKDRERVIRLVQRGKSVYIKSVIPSLFAEEFRIGHKDLIQQLIHTANTYSDQGIIANIRGMMGRVDRSNVLANGEFPKLIVHGELDSVISTADAEKQAQLNQNITLEKIPSVGHMGHLEAKERTLSVLKDFCLN